VSLLIIPPKSNICGEDQEAVTKRSSLSFYEIISNDWGKVIPGPDFLKLFIAVIYGFS
jgi:hypothetical protein